jgi:hypothetical protein
MIINTSTLQDHRYEGHSQDLNIGKVALALLTITLSEKSLVYLAQFIS